MVSGSRHLDVTLTLDLAGGGDVYRPTWGVRGRTTEVGDALVELPHEEVRAFEAGLLASRGGGEELPPHAVLERARGLGTRLFDALFQGSVRAAYARAYAEAKQSYTGLRLRLQLHENLQTLPFELLYDPLHGLFLAANTFTTLVRGTLGTAVTLPTVEYPLRLLVVVAAPRGAPRLDVEAELRRLDRGLGNLSELKIWDREVLRGPDTLQQLQFHPHKSRFHVLHYIGHGWLDVGRGGNGLVLEDAKGDCELTAPHELNSVLAGYHNLRLVVLNACHGARQLDDRPFGSVAHWLLKLDIAAVVAMRREIADSSALVFTDHLYRGIANCRPIDEAVTLARTSLARARDQFCAGDWFNPQLFLRSEEGTLFTTRDDRKAYEYLAEDALAKDDVARALTVCERAGDWEGSGGHGPDDRFVQLLRRVGDKAVRRRAWDVLSDLVRLCDSRGLQTLSPLKLWGRVVANRRRWQDEVLAGLRDRLTGGDPVRAGQALAECDRLLGLFSRDQKAQQHELYGGDADMWRAFWAEDFGAVRDLRGQYKGPVLSSSVLHVAEVLARLHEQGGVAVAAPAGWERTSDEPARQSEDDLFVHPLHAPQALLAARQRLLEEGARRGDDSPAALVEWLVPTLGEDAALVFLALDMPTSALERWEREILSAPEPMRLLTLYHHLALAALPAAGQVWDESRLAPWAVLFAEDASGSVTYGETWHRVLGRLETWLDAELSELRPARLPDSPVAPTESSPAIREMVFESLDRAPEPEAFANAAAPPTLLTPLGRWFRAERAAARVLFRSRCGPLARLPLAGGLGMVRRLNLASALEAIYGQLASRPARAETATRPGLDVLFELRGLFSSLAAAWLTIHGNGEPEAALECLRELSCPACRSRIPAADASAAFLQQLPEAWRPTLCQPDCSAFAARNPLHAVLPDGRRLFLADVRRLTLAALLDLAARRLTEDGGGVRAFADLLAAAAPLDNGWPETEQRVQALQQAAVTRAAALDLESSAVFVAATLDVLECLARFGAGQTMRVAFTHGYLISAQQLLEDEPSKARDCAVKALQWSEDSMDARAVVCLFIVREAKRLAWLGESAAARACLHEFRRVMDAAERRTPELLKLKDEADELAGELDRTSPPSDDLPEADDLLWQERAEEADQAIRAGNHERALEYLGDAAVMAPKEPHVEEALVRLFLRLADDAEDPRRRVQTLQQARKHFPDHPELQG